MGDVLGRRLTLRAESRGLQVHFLLHALCLCLPLVFPLSLDCRVRGRHIYRLPASRLQFVVWPDRADTDYPFRRLEMDLYHLHHSFLYQPWVRTLSRHEDHPERKRSRVVSRQPGGAPAECPGLEWPGIQAVLSLCRADQEQKGLGNRCLVYLLQFSG